MKKRLITLTLSAVLACSLAACGNVTNTGSSAADEEQGGSSIESEDLSEGESENAPDDSAFADASDESRGPALLGVHTERVYESEWSDELDQPMASRTYSTVSLDEGSASYFPELQSSLDELNREKEHRSQETYDELLGFAREDAANYTDSYIEHETTEEVKVRRADTRVLSLLYNGFYYGGGAHGSYFYWGENFDTKTGKKLELSDVITDMDALPQLVQEQLDIYWGDVGFYEGLDLKEFFSDPDHMISWTLDYNGVTIFFNPYDIAPYASGSQNITILFADHPELFDMQYQTAADRFGVELSFENQFYFDLDNDGTEEVVLISGSRDEYGHYTMQTISVNGHWYEDETDGYSIDPVFLHTADGTSYLYLQNDMDNDWEKITVFDLSSGDTQKIDTIFAGKHTLESDEPGYYPIEEAITDPEHFYLDTHTELLSTVTGTRPYHVGENGMPVSEQNYYDLVWPIELTFRQNIELELADPETCEPAGMVSVEAGTRASYIRTDGEKYAYLLLPDGRMIRAEVVLKDWERFVQDININDLFDGIVFAG